MRRLKQYYFYLLFLLFQRTVRSIALKIMINICNNENMYQSSCQNRLDERKLNLILMNGVLHIKPASRGYIECIQLDFVIVFQHIIPFPERLVAASMQRWIGLNSFRLGEYIFDSEFSSSHLELCNRLTTCVEAILIPYSDNNPLGMKTPCLGIAN